MFLNRCFGKKFDEKWERIVNEKQKEKKKKKNQMWEKWFKLFQKCPFFLFLSLFIFQLFHFFHFSLFHLFSPFSVFLLIFSQFLCFLFVLFIFPIYSFLLARLSPIFREKSCIPQKEYFLTKKIKISEKIFQNLSNFLKKYFYEIFDLKKRKKARKEKKMNQKNQKKVKQTLSSWILSYKRNSKFTQNHSSNLFLNKQNSQN